MAKKIVFIIFCVLIAPVVEAQIILPPNEIIVPDSSMYSEVGDFQVEWCGANEIPGSVKQVCFGSSRFQSSQAVRAIGLKVEGSENEVFVEAQWPKIDLMNLKFTVIGPIQKATVSEFGDIALEIDERGEVIALKGRTPRHGYFTARSPRGF